jgi:hypothetical protein
MAVFPLDIEISPNNRLLFSDKKGPMAKTSLVKEPDLPALTSKKTSIEAIPPYYADRNLL